ncbi:hypothetical protein ACIHAA_27470 [Streptomyces sp. NPDC052040]|uniref:hypothetical protein n=1 Tax=unclassified Streptomyces TaxID=2593676 RepID=UPI0037CDF8A8
MRITKKTATAAAAALSVAVLGVVGVGAHTAAAAPQAVTQAPAADAGIQVNMATDTTDSQVRPGEEIVVSGLVTNTSDHTLTNLRIDVAMPQAEVEQGQIAPREGLISNTPAYGNAVWNVPSLKPGHNFAVDVKFRVLPSALVGAQIPVNVAVLSADNKNLVASSTEFVTVIAPRS